MSTQTIDSDNPVVAKALAQIGDIATLPEVTVKVMEMVEDPETAAAELHWIIKHDPALSTKVLSVVNSAFYGLPGQVADLERAIVLLGGAAVKNLAIAVSLARIFNVPQRGDHFDARGLWTHGVAVAVAAKAINAVARNPAAPDEVFLGGLIHDLGVLVERQAFPDGLNEVIRLCRAGVGDFLQLERAIIGATHQEFGDALATAWRFPPRLRAAISYHHDPTGLPDELLPMGLTVRCADILCSRAAYGFDLVPTDRVFTQELLDALGVTEEQLAEVRCALAAGLVEADAVLGSRH